MISILSNAFGGETHDLRLDHANIVYNTFVKVLQIVLFWYIAFALYFDK